MKKKRLLTIASSVLLAFVMILGTMPGLNQMAYASDDSWTIADEIEEDILIEPAEEIIIEATDELEESDVLEYELVGSSEDPFYSYTVKSDGTICIDKYLGDEQVVVIPSTIEGAIVTEIGANAFQNCTGITELGFPENLTAIGSSAFQNCSGLTALDLPGGVTTIGAYAFADCTGLTEIMIHDVPDAQETIDRLAFRNCTSLQKVSVPASAVYYYLNVFDGSTAISEVTVTGSGEMSGSGPGPWYSAGGDITVTIADGVTSIRSGAFSGFAHDIELVLADSVESIGDNAFSNCTGLSMGTVETVLNSEAVLGSNIFSGCTGLDGALSVPRELPSGAFSGCTGLSSVTLADGITIIPNSAFQNCTGITELGFPENLTAIGSSAFQNCSGLTALDLPGGVTTIGAYAFADCTGLTEIMIHDVPDAQETIDRLAFRNCTSLQKVSVPASAVYYYLNVFDGSTAISEVTVTGSGEMSGSGPGPWYSAGDDVIVIIEDGVTNIRNGMFSGSSNMIMTVIPNSVKTIGNNAFNNCTSLADVYFIGWKEEWDGITKGSGNSGLDEAEIYTLDDAAKENYTDATCVTDGKYDAVLYYKEQMEIARVTIEIPANGHAFAYTLSDDEKSITAVCSIATCPSGYHENGITIKLNVPENLSWDGNAKNATISGYPSDVPGLADEPEIIYYKSGGEGSTIPSGEPLSAAPSAIGSYVARITWGEQTASAAFTIKKATYRIVTVPSASPITYGQTLKDSALSSGEAEIKGSFAWKDNSTAPAVSDSGRTQYAVVFTPDDIEHYDTAECKVTVIVNKAAASVASAPTAKALAWSGQAQKLVDEGIAEFGVMRYSIGQNETTAPRSGWSESVPEASDPNTYYVWYKAAGDENHYDSEAACVTSTITAKQISYTVTFKVVNGAWNDQSTVDKTVTLSRYENEDLALKLRAEDIPAVGNKPADHYKAGSWDVVPDTETAITKNTVYTYTYAANPTVTYAFSDVQDPKHAYFKAIYWAADAGITKGYPDGTFGINRSCTRGEMMMFLWRYADKPAPKNASKSPFKDVKTNHAFYKAILWGSQKGITKGYADGTFGIDRNVTRGEAMMFLWRLRGKPAPKAVAKSPFKDVPKNHVFYNAILWGSQNKITTGYTSGVNKGKFMVDDNCTRGQIVTFLYRAK